MLIAPLTPAAAAAPVRPTDVASPLAFPAPAGTRARTTKVVAHRGVHGPGEPIENTIDSYLRAIRMGVDVMETDVRRTKDGVIVLAHDAWIGMRRISSTNYADLPRLANGQPISTLNGLVDAIAGAGGNTKLLVETKEAGYEAEITQIVGRRLRADQVEYMSFNQDSVRALRELAPASRVGVLYTSLLPDWGSGTWPISGAAMVAAARDLKVDFVAIDGRLADNARLDALAGAGISTAVWTINTRADLRRFIGDPRIAAVITDASQTAMDIRDGVA